MLYQWIIQNYEMYKFGVLGPSIYSVNANFYQSPIRNLSKDKREISRSIREMQISLLKIKLKTLFNIKNSNSSLEQWENSQYEELHDNLTLHGAFQVMSKRYFDEYSEAYDKGTFLYYEEDILKLRCDKASLPMIYSPDYTVNHLQSFSTNSNEKNVNKKHAITIYPEAHIWPYYTKIRPFKTVSFKYPIEFNTPAFCMTNTYQSYGKNKDKIKIVTYIDGPFFPDKNLTKSEQKQNLRDQIYNKMVERSKNSNIEHIKYEKISENKRENS